MLGEDSGECEGELERGRRGESWMGGKPAQTGELSREGWRGTWGGMFAFASSLQLGGCILGRWIHLWVKWGARSQNSHTQHTSTAPRAQSWVLDKVIFGLPKGGQGRGPGEQASGAVGATPEKPHVVG